MYVVIGTWEIDGAREAEQRAGLARIVDGVSQLPDVHRGYWCAGEDSTRSFTFIVFNTKMAAEAFAEDVKGNVENQARAGVKNLSLEVARVTATTS